jgi:hypothetical protein
MSHVNDLKRKAGHQCRLHERQWETPARDINCYLIREAVWHASNSGSTPSCEAASNNGWSPRIYQLIIATGKWATYAHEAAIRGWNGAWIDVCLRSLAWGRYGWKPSSSRRVVRSWRPIIGLIQRHICHHVHLYSLERKIIWRFLSELWYSLRPA